MKKKKTKEPMISTKDTRFRSFLMSVLRRASRFWKPSNECINKTRITRGVHICPSCKKACRRKDMKKDHIEPVIPVTGFTTWDDVVNRMFIEEEGWQAICTECHDIKTKKENEERKALKKERAVIGYYTGRRKKKE